MLVRFWGTRGSIPTPGHHTAMYGGNTSCVSIRTDDGTLIVLDCGTGIRELGLELLKSHSGPYRIHMLIGHTHWDHIQGFPFFTPAFLPGTELNIYAPSGFQRSLEDALSGQMQYSYFPIKLQHLSSRIHFTELEEGFFRIGEVLVETQYLNHTAPTIAYRVSSGGASVVYVTDHEPYGNYPGSAFRHPGDQGHIDFLRNADLVIHDSQYTCEEYSNKRGWGHSTTEYATDVAVAAGVKRLALFHHDPTHNDGTIQQIEADARKRIADSGNRLDVFAAAEGLEIDVEGSGEMISVAGGSALERRSISGRCVLIVSDQNAEIRAIEEVLAEDGLVLTPVQDGRTALECAAAIRPDLIILSAAEFIEPLRNLLGRPDLPVLLLTDSRNGSPEVANASMATDFLANPFSPPMLRTRVRAWLARAAAAGGRSDATATAGAALPEKMDRSGILRAVPLFGALTAGQLDAMLESSREEIFPTGHMVVRQGTSGGDVYVVLAGRVGVLESVPESPADMLLGELGSGEVFGELGILGERPRTASVITLEKTTCLRITQERFLEALHASPEMSIALLRILARRLYDADRLLARHAPDTVTGLPGRRAFNDFYRRLAASSRRRKTSVLLLAIDVVHLKDINDRYGYSVGNDVLRTVADALLDSSRSTDLVARSGSDEFAALLVEAGAKDAEIVMERVQQKLRDMTAQRGLPLTVECSIGFAVSDNPPETADDLLRAADQDMQSKRYPQIR